MFSAEQGIFLREQGIAAEQQGLVSASAMARHARNNPDRRQGCKGPMGLAKRLGHGNSPKAPTPAQGKARFVPATAVQKTRPGLFTYDKCRSRGQKYFTRRCEVRRRIRP